MQGEPYRCSRIILHRASRRVLRKLVGQVHCTAISFIFRIILDCSPCFGLVYCLTRWALLSDVFHYGRRRWRLVGAPLTAAALQVFLHDGKDYRVLVHIVLWFKWEGRMTWWGWSSPLILNYFTKKKFPSSYRIAVKEEKMSRKGANGGRRERRGSPKSVMKPKSTSLVLLLLLHTMLILSLSSV